MDEMHVGRDMEVVEEADAKKGNTIAYVVVRSSVFFFRVQSWHQVAQ